MTRARTARTVVRAHRQQPVRQGLSPLPFLRAAPAAAAARWARILAESGWADEDPDFMARPEDKLADEPLV